MEAFGCQPATYYSVPAVFVVWFPPLLLAVISMIYACKPNLTRMRVRSSLTCNLEQRSPCITSSAIG